MGPKRGRKVGSPRKRKVPSPVAEQQRDSSPLSADPSSPAEDEDDVPCAQTSPPKKSARKSAKSTAATKKGKAPKKTSDLKKAKKASKISHAQEAAASRNSDSDVASIGDPSSSVSSHESIRPVPAPSQVVTQKSKKERRQAALLTSDQREEMSVWLQDPERRFLIDIKNANYKNAEKRAAAWQEKAKDLNTDATSLKLWWDSTRTRVTKIFKKESSQPSGTAYEDFQMTLTDLEKELYSMFKWFKGYSRPVASSSRSQRVATASGGRPNKSASTSVKAPSTYGDESLCIDVDSQQDSAATAVVGEEARPASSVHSSQRLLPTEVSTKMSY
jgi:hypothetical protein